MVAAVQVVHGLHGDHDDGVDFAALGGADQAEFKLAAAGDDVIEDLIDGVLILAGPARDHGAKIGFNRSQETGGGGIVLEFALVGKETAKIVVVKVGPLASVVGALLFVVFA